MSILPKDDKARVFISYSNHDKEYADRLGKELSKRGISFVTSDQGDITDLLNCDAFVPILSRNYLKDRIPEIMLVADLPSDNYVSTIPLVIDKFLNDEFPWKAVADYVDARDGSLPTSRFYDVLVDTILSRKARHELSSVRVFVSYHSGDWNECVARLAQGLRANFHDVWVDQRELQGGQDWLDEISDALASCSVLILFVSPAALASKYVKMEYRYFIDRGKPVVPLICRETELPIELHGIQYIKLGELGEFEELSKLVELIKRVSSSI